MPVPNTGAPYFIRCPIRRKSVSSLVCHTCTNHIRVQFKSELSPELQCSKWDWGMQSDLEGNAGA